MEKEFVTYEQSLALKELGFNEKCMGYFDVRLEHQIGNFDFTEIKGYDESIAALSPLKQQVFRWFREKYNLYSAVNVDQTTEPKFAYCISSYWHDALSWGWDTIIFNSDLYYEYEEAENACIDKLIKLTKTK
jgi:hypothetical protein